jgi:lysophospholipase L1-like esterase
MGRIKRLAIRMTLVAALVMAIIAVHAFKGEPAFAVSNTPANGSIVVGPGCNAIEKSVGAQPSYIAAGDYTGHTTYGDSSTPLCTDTTFYILDVSGSATSTFEWIWGSPTFTNIPNLEGQNCGVWTYIPTTDAGDRHARYDIWGITPSGTRNWLFWPGKTIDQENTSGWIYLGSHAMGGNAQIEVTLGNSDPTSPGWYTGAGDMAFSCTIPAPTGVTVAVTSPTNVHVSWTDNTGGTAQYLVTNGDTDSTTLPAGTTSTDWGPITPGTYMCFAVIASVPGGWSAWSPYACLTTPVPTATNVTATATSPTSILVSWTDNTGGTAKYVVGNGVTTSPVQPAGTFIYNWIGLTPGTNMCFEVQAQGVSASSPWSASACATTTVPSPTNLTAVATSAGNIHLSWSDPSGGAANFVIGNGTGTQMFIPPKTTSADWGFEANPEALTAGTSMCFTVIAEQGSGQSAPSSQACATTLPASADAYVNLGDSISAGEGALNYISGTNNPGTDMCHRSNSSYSAQYVGMSTLYTSVKNVACSGAVMADLSAAPGPVNGGGNATVGELAQLPALSPYTKLVTVTIGANDANLVGLLSGCYEQIKPASIDSCFLSSINSQLFTTISGLQLSLESTYSQIKQAAPNAQIAVLTYPQIYAQSYSGSNLANLCPTAPVQIITSQAQVDAVRSVVTALNNVIKAAASAAGVQVFDMEGALYQHELCTVDPADPTDTSYSWVNPVLGSITGQGFVPADESFHPTANGYQAVASQLKAYLGGN